MPIVRPQNLNEVFLQAANAATQKLPELSHNQKVRAQSGVRTVVVPVNDGRDSRRSTLVSIGIPPSHMLCLTFICFIIILLSFNLDRLLVYTDIRFARS
jgi:hypothetical protein